MMGSTAYVYFGVFFFVSSCLRLSWTRYCSYPYPCTYPCSYTVRYTISCGFWGGSRCKRYRKEYKTCGKTCYRQDCCPGYQGYSCHIPICYDRTYCPNGGVCVRPNTCSCPLGFTEGAQCQDLNECDSDKGGCQHNCQNTHGSFKCSCRSGYDLQGDKRTCINIDECASSNGGCQHICTDNAGSYTCSCNDGFSLIDGKNCRDTDECSIGTAECAQICTNNIGSFNCSCRRGYVTNRMSCEDIDECQNGSSGCSHGCENLNGTYKCSCNESYQLGKDWMNCTEISDLCSSTNITCDHMCLSDGNSTYCECRDGYVLGDDNSTCTDINECTENLHNCSHNCINIIGTFECSCNPDYILSDDYQSCKTISLCFTSSNTCDQICVDESDSLHCECRDGYNLGADKLSCNDIDECAMRIDNCSQMCTNTVGSFLCSCNDGYYLSNDSKTCINNDRCASTPCKNGATCDNHVFTYTCICPGGFTGPQCEEILIYGECSPNETVCFTKHAECLPDENSTETFSCQCRREFIFYPDWNKCLTKSGHNQACVIDNQCKTTEAKCIFKTGGGRSCECPPETVYNQTANECIPNATLFCNAAKDHLGLQWNKTRVHTTLLHACPSGSSGEVRRTCREDGTFSTAWYACTKDVYQNLTNKILSSSSSTTEALGAVNDSLSGLKSGSTVIYSGDIDSIEHILSNITGKDSNESSVDKLTKNAEFFFDIASVLTDPGITGVVYKSKLEETSNGAEKLIETIDMYSQNLAKTLQSTEGSNLTFRTANLVVSVSKVSDDLDVDLKYPADDGKSPFNASRTSSFKLSSESLGPNVSSMVVVLYLNISTALPKRKRSSAQNETLFADFGIDSSVMSIQLLPNPPKVLNPPIQLTFTIDQIRNDIEPQCAFLKPSTDSNSSQSYWSTDGCVRTMVSGNTVQCTCSHLTNFAILTSRIETPVNHRLVLSVMSLVGCGVTIVCLVITLIVYGYYWRFLKGPRNVLVMTLCISLLVAYLLFVFGVTRTSNKIACISVALLLHYTFLLVFCILLSEGVYMMLNVLFPFHKKSHIKELLIGSFATPAVIVGISASVTQLRGYGNDQYCWLTVSSVAFWTFVGPASFVVVVNLIILILIMKTMHGTKWMKNMKQREKAKILTSKTLVLLPVMGVTWAFGILSVHAPLVWLQYPFVIFNSFQGLFIFLFHCVLSKPLRAAIAKSKARFANSNSSPKNAQSSTVKSEVRTDDSNPPATMSEEELRQFKRRHALPMQPGADEDNSGRPPTQVFIDLRHELMGRLQNMFLALTSSTVPNSSQPQQQPDYLVEFNKEDSVGSVKDCFGGIEEEQIRIEELRDNEEHLD